MGGLDINVIVPSFSAKNTVRPIPVAIVLFERTKLIDVCGPLQVFNDARTANELPAYGVDLLSQSGGLVGTDTVTPLQTLPFCACSEESWDTVIVSGGRSAYEAALSAGLLNEIARIAPDCRRLASVCLGAFILAAGGHLKGRRATTHWEGCQQLATDHPDVTVVDDAIFVSDRGVWTSAGVTSGIDMALAMVEEDLGRAEALRLAKSMVLPARRAGGQRQFSDALRVQVSSSETRFASLVSEMLANPAQDLAVSQMAAKAHMSERHFARVFTTKMGATPGRFVERLRVERACELMHQSGANLKAIVGLAGFANAEQMRRAFQRVRGVSPTEYRVKFGRDGSIQ
ncbi:MAG: helix-turn-helix domain-containing protein [Pseudomonadota bacterium]